MFVARSRKLLCTSLLAVFRSEKEKYRILVEENGRMIFIESSNKGRQWWSHERRERLRRRIRCGARKSFKKLNSGNLEEKKITFIFL